MLLAQAWIRWIRWYLFVTTAACEKCFGVRRDDARPRVRLDTGLLCVERWRVLVARRPLGSAACRLSHMASGILGTGSERASLDAGPLALGLTPYQRQPTSATAPATSAGTASNPMSA